jgi:hypothetical protein
VDPGLEEAAMYGIIVRSSEPISMYHAVSEEVDKRAKEFDHDMWRDCLMHLCRETDDGGFEVTEVWTSQGAAQEFWDNVLRPAIEVRGYSADAIREATTRFEPVVFEVNQRDPEDA